MQLSKIIVPLSGVLFTFGVILLVFDLLTLGKRGSPAAIAARGEMKRAIGRWSRTLHGFEAGIWLLVLWVFGAVITLGLLSFNLAAVRAGDPTLPYVMAIVGYPGLLLTTLLLVWRFLQSLEARQHQPVPLRPARSDESPRGKAALPDNA